MFHFFGSILVQLGSTLNKQDIAATELTAQQVVACCRAKKGLVMALIVRVGLKIRVSVCHL